EVVSAGRDGDIGIAVPIQVRGDDPDGAQLGADGKSRAGSELACAIVLQDPDSAGAVAGNQDLKLAVAVQIGDGDGTRIGADVVACGCEGPRAVVQEDRNRARIAIGD